MTTNTMTCITCEKRSNVKNEFKDERHGNLILTLCVDFKECISRYTKTEK